MKPICVSCKRFYRIKKNGYSFIEGMPTVNDAPKGLSGDGQWVPYKLWVGDLWECPDCYSLIVVGVGQHPIAEHYQSEFKEKITIHQPGLQVNDC